MTIRQVGYRLKAEGKEEVKRDLREVGAEGKVAGEAIRGSFGAAGAAIQQASGYSDAQMAKFKRMAQAAREFQSAQEQQAKFNSLLGVGGGTGLGAKDFLSADEVAGKGMTRSQRAGRLNLLRQGADVFTTGAMGMDPMMIAIQQGPQILDALATSGFKASGSLLALGGAVIGVAGAVALLAKAGLDAENQFRKIDVAVNGLGATANVSAEQLQTAIDAGREVGEVSVQAATEMGVAYVSTGKIGKEVLGDLIGLTRDYAATTNQDATAATDELAKAFSKGAQGVAELNDKLHFLDAAELKHIQNLYDAGDAAAAQREMIDKLEGSLIDASSATSGWAQAWDTVKIAAANAWREVGKAVAVAMGGGADNDRLTSLLESRNMALARGFSTAELDKDIADLRRKIQAEAEQRLRAGQNDRSVQAQVIRDQFADPKIKALQDQQNLRKRYLSLGGKEGDDTVKAIDAEISALKAGYSSAADQANKLEQAHRKAVAAGTRQAREDAKELREATRQQEELKRQQDAAADHALDQARKLAAIRGDTSEIDFLQRQADLQQEINRYLAEGLELQQARYRATAQIAAEMQAESDALRKERSSPDDFVSSADRMAKFSDLKLDTDAGKAQFLESLRIDTGEAFHDGLVSGMMSGNFFEVFRDRLKYAAAEGLADSLTNKVFGQKKGGGGGLMSLVSAGISLLSGGGSGASLTKAASALNAKNAALVKAGYATGTESAVEGWAWVGEDGPELRKVRAGDQIRSTAASLAMVRQANARSDGVGAGFTVNANFAPVLTVNGGDSEEIAQLRADLADMKVNFVRNVTEAVNDGLQRRTIRADAA